MTTNPEQRALRTLYCNLMAEIRFRLEIVARSMDGDYKLPAQAAHELCYLQLRMVCEVIALGCLAVHGDIPATQTSRVMAAYAADWIFKALEKMHPDFYPEPGEHIRHPDDMHEFIPTDRPHLPKPELVKLYNDAGDILHRGTMKAFQEDKGYPDLSFDRIFDATGRIAGLLSCHRIRLINPREELLVTMHSPETGKVQAILCVGTD